MSIHPSAPTTQYHSNGCSKNKNTNSHSSVTIGITSFKYTQRDSNPRLLDLPYLVFRISLIGYKRVIVSFVVYFNSFGVMLSWGIRCKKWCKNYCAILILFIFLLVSMCLLLYLWLILISLSRHMLLSVSDYQKQMVT